MQEIFDKKNNKLKQGADFNCCVSILAAVDCLYQIKTTQGDHQ